MPAGSMDPEIKGLTQDSRQVREGWIFAALAGSKLDGTRFIADAVRNGAVAIVVKTGTALPPEASAVTVIACDNPRHDFSLMAAQFYGRQPGRIVAVTGTNGKTSTVHFTQQLWKALGCKSASLGTLGVRGHGMVRSGSMTTPDPVALHGTLADMAAAGVTHLAMEASSHGLEQCRLDGVQVSAAGFTNLTRDHLDYHPDMEAYFAAKARLFGTVLRPGGIAVVNDDVPEAKEIRKICIARNIRVLGYGVNGDELKLARRTPMPRGQEVEIAVLGQTFCLTIPLVGAFQIMNALCALGLAMADDVDNQGRTAELVNAMAALQGAPGRLQLVPGTPEGMAIYVDYAHTPDALANILAALRPHTEGRLVCLFGCGGDRDPGKRPIMGQIAARDADAVIVTDDNPRSEDPAKIRAAILAGAGDRANEIGGRREAIRSAVSELRQGDVLVLAGKGHEQGQIFADHVEPFDDFEEAMNAVEGLKGAA